MEEYHKAHRSAIVVIPLEHFLNRIDKIETSETLSLSEVQKDRNVHLIPGGNQPINTDDLDNEIENYTVRSENTEHLYKILHTCISG